MLTNTMPALLVLMASTAVMVVTRHVCVNGTPLPTSDLHGEEVQQCPSGPAPTWSVVEVSVPAPVMPATCSPFNTSQIRFQATFAASGVAAAAMQVAGFYDGDRFSARATFAAAGQVAATGTLEVTDSSACPGVALPPPVSCHFTVTAAEPSPAPAAGIVRVGANRQHFVVSDAVSAVTPTTPTTSNTSNSAFVGVGMNLAWDEAALGLGGYEPYLRNMSEQGANYIRVWATDSWDIFFLEQQLGNYSLTAARNIDGLLAMTQRHGIRVLLTIESFNLFCSHPNAPCSWSKCVYNKANTGGFLATADAFFSNERAKAYFRQRLSYIVARYGAYSSLFAWEFFNEVDITDNFNATLQAEWVDGMAAHVHAHDVFQHPVSTSFCCHDVSEVYQLPSVDFAMTHSYGTHNQQDMADNAQYWTARQAAEYDKPTYVAESGELGAQYSGRDDPTGIGLHNMLWAPLFAGGSMTTMTWWWDTWVAPYGLYTHFQGVAEFAKLVSWSAYRWTLLPPAQPPSCTDVPPGGGYTCAQQKSWGKCNETWMQGFCCKTCFDCSAACLGPPAHAGKMLTAHARLLAATGAAVGGIWGDGDAGDAVAATVAVAWVQNSNNTWALQANHTAPVDAISGAAFQLPGMAGPGPYTVRWIDTATGTVSHTEQLACSSEVVGAEAGAGVGVGAEGGDGDCMLAVHVPTFTTDIAAIIDR